jgi:hypothetical protein
VLTQCIAGKRRKCRNQDVRICISTNHALEYHLNTVEACSTSNLFSADTFEDNNPKSVVHGNVTPERSVSKNREHKSLTIIIVSVRKFLDQTDCIH